MTYEDDDLPNPKLRWEKTATYNIGLDFRLFKNLISGTLEYYNRHSSDLLVRRYMDPTLGAGSRVVNNGEMRNRGVELSLSANIIRKKDWNFAVDFNFDHNKNKMLKVDHSESDNASLFIKSPLNYFMEGTSYNTLWAYRIDRMENGYPVAVDKDGNDLVKFNEDGTVASITSGSSLKGTDDLVNLGSLTPQFSGSVGLRFNYKNFDLNVDFNGVSGNKILDLKKTVSWTTTNFYEKSLQRWHGEGTSNKEPILDKSRGHNYLSSTNLLENGSYLRLRNVQLGYTLPSSAISKLGISGLRVYVSGQNLLTFKHNTGYTPEIGGSALQGGMDQGDTYPLPSVYTVGLSINF